jgi:hypothetical protein
MSEHTLAAGQMRPQFRLRPGQDDALIAWLAAVAPRQRSQAIRRALRDYLAARPETGERGRNEDPALAAALDALF